ncbi:MAG TPA: prepilin-type N-terminal cleavage/methylation domain-containing protein [Acidobacteriota bacterium]
MERTIRNSQSAIRNPKSSNPQSAIRIPQLSHSAFRIPQSRRGFTLIEVVIVLVIIAVAMAVVMPSMRTGLAGMRLEAKGRDFVTLCRTARTLAVGEQRVYRIAVQRDRNIIFLADAYHDKVHDFGLSDEIKVSSVKFEGEESRDPAVYISFYPNGRADDAELVLENDRGRKVIVKTDVITGSAKLTIPKERG